MPTYFFTVFEVDSSYYFDDAQSLILDRNNVQITDSPDTYLHRSQAEDDGNDQTLAFAGEPTVDNYTIEYLDYATVNGAGMEYELYAMQVIFTDGSVKYYVLSKDDNFNPEIGDDLAVSTFSTFSMTDYGDLGSAVCFAKGTSILTDKGEQPVENLRQGDLVQTMDNALSEILWIGRKTIPFFELFKAETLRPVRIAAGVLHNHTPIWLSQQHRVMCDHRAFPHPKQQGQFFAKAKHLAMHCPELAQIDFDVREVSYYHLLLSRHEVIFANGLASESLSPGPCALRGISRKDRRELETIISAPADRTKSRQCTRYSQARPTLKSHEVQHLIWSGPSKSIPKGRLKRADCPPFRPTSASEGTTRMMSI